jgi:hypothetical protein
MYRVSNQKVPAGRSGLTLVAALLTGIVSAGAASAETLAQCDNQSAFAAGQLRVSESRGRLSVEVQRPQSAGRKIDVEYGDEVYSQKFGSDGRVRVAFSLTAPENQVTITTTEMLPVTCTVKVPEFAKVNRVIVRWHDPVQLNLYVLEPGGRPGEVGEVDGTRPNQDHKSGIGEMDIVGGVPVEESTGEMAYSVDVAAIPEGGVFGYKLDYMSRGSMPEPPFCDDNPLATPQFDFITITRGEVKTAKMGMNRAHCREKIPDNRRLMQIRQ